MRLDLFFSEHKLLTRKTCQRAAREGRIAVDGVRVTDSSFHINPEVNSVSLDGVTIKYEKFVYILLNKPAGVVSSTEDSGRTVLELLPSELQKRSLFPCGRLDRDTEGLMLITDDGQTAHALLSPKRHVAKTYLYCCTKPLSAEDAATISNGVELKDGKTKECFLRQPTSEEVRLLISERNTQPSIFGMGSDIDVISKSSTKPRRRLRAVQTAARQTVPTELYDSLSHEQLACIDLIRYDKPARDNIEQIDESHNEEPCGSDNKSIIKPSETDFCEDERAHDTEYCGAITLSEGRYHQIKRMFGSLRNRITYLMRSEFAELSLDGSLEKSEWRFLTEAEKQALINR
ncbi:MAG: pseudouridine synthase [Clostridia bacterium]|nr:pseudouridine synthase [Clostridia bacterium]